MLAVIFIGRLDLEKDFSSMDNH